MTKEEMEIRADELAQDHWKYIEELLDAHYVAVAVRSVAEFHYYEAFKHGYKHCWEDLGADKISGQIMEIKL